MKDYKRLTSYMQIGNNVVAILPQRKERIQAYIDRLADLEDKIERGELVDRNEYLDYLMTAKNTSELTDKEIEFFAKHNARVREDTDAEIARLTAENENLTVELEVAQRDVENLTRTLEEANDEIKALEAENDELRATLSKMETVEKELRARLEKAIELPYVKRDCELTQIIYKNSYGDMEEETYFHDCYYGERHDVRGDVYAEARLAELEGGEQ